VGVTANLYLALMLGVMAVCLIVSIPSLFRKKCPNCGVRNGLDAKTCKSCQVPFAEEDQQP